MAAVIKEQSLILEDVDGTRLRITTREGGGLTIAMQPPNCTVNYVKIDGATTEKVMDFLYDNLA